jgi:hypothetical protein
LKIWALQLLGGFLVKAQEIDEIAKIWSFSKDYTMKISILSTFSTEDMALLTTIYYTCIPNSFSSS